MQPLSKRIRDSVVRTAAAASAHAFHAPSDDINFEVRNAALEFEALMQKVDALETRTHCSQCGAKL